MTEVNNELTRKFTDIMTHQRDVVLFDMIARGLALTYRPFNAVEISRGILDVSQIPTLWVMMERQCDARTQQKLVDYIRQGGKLILAGRICLEDFNGQACTLLKDAIGIKEIQEDAPFVVKNIDAFGYRDVPVSFIETYTGDFDEVFATRGDAEVVGFIKSIGAGKVLVFGAAMCTETLGDIDIVHQMAVKMSCPSLFAVPDWADMRISRGENGSFLFVNNYQDDPVETMVVYQGETLFGGNPVTLAARTGLILPLEWQPRPGIRIHYCTSEIVELAAAGAGMALKTQQPEFFAELTLNGYRCDGAVAVQRPDGSRRVQVHATAGEIVLQPDSG
jgi:beta-galactosidase